MADVAGPSVKGGNPLAGDPHRWPGRMARLLPDLGLVLAFHICLRLLFHVGFVLPEAAYHKPILFSQLVVLKPLLLLAWLVPTGFLFLNWRHLQWSRLELGPQLRVPVIAIAAILAWTFSTYGYNPYYGYSHAIDRAVLVLLALGTWKHPAFTPVFVLQTLVIIGQLRYPLEELDWTDKILAIDHLILFSAFLLVLRLGSGLRGMDYVFLACCLQISGYFWPGVGKVAMGWLGLNELFVLIGHTYTRGWLCFVDEPAIAGIGKLLRTLNTTALWTTVLVELSGVLFFLHRRFAYGVISAWIGLHLAIFASSGILFWKWIVVDVALGLLLLRLHRSEHHRLFGLRPWSVSVLLVSFAPLYFQPIMLVWFDTRYDVSYHLEAVGESGTIYQVEPAFMAPYDILFNQTRFWFLSPERFLVRDYGATNDRDVFAAIRDAGRWEGFRQLEAAEGAYRYDAGRANRFDHFMRTFFADLNEHRSRWLTVNFVAPPLHISSCRRNPYEMQEKVVSVRVRIVRTYYDGEKLDRFDDRIIREVRVLDAR